MSSSPAERAVRWENVTFSYGEQSRYNVLECVSLAVSAEKFTVLTGPSGCGKSTLLYLAAGLYPGSGGFVRSGRVTVDGQEPGALLPEKRARLLTMIFQNPDLQSCMDTVEHELIFCMENIALPVEEMDARLEQALAFCGITHLRTRRLATLSGGEKQRAMLACAVVLRPRWLLLDEPFANLDEDSARTLAARLRRLHDEYGVGILAVDHDPRLWLGAADELVTLSPEGQFLERGPLPAAVTPYQDKKPPKVPRQDCPLVLEGLTVHKDGRAILDCLSARFQAGHIHAILGPSGCGKSTLFQSLCGMERYQGRVLVDGRELGSLRPKALGGLLGFVFQSPQDQFVAGTVLDEIALSLRCGGSADAQAQARRILEEMGLWRHRKLSPYMLSQGQQRRLGVAALLAYRCRVLVCDEPTYAQDRANVLAIMEQLQRRVVNEGLTLVFSTHDRLLARCYADHIYELREGTLHETT